MERQIIFIAGVHGVGKTNFCKAITQQLFFDHITASELIRKYKKQADDQKKRVTDVEKNQDILIRSLNAYKSPHTTLLLDGHFCLLDPQLEIQKIPITTFEHISPISVIVLIEDAKTIQERLMNRDNESYEVSFIDSFQFQEIEHARYVCQLLDIPLLVVNPTKSIDEAVSFLKMQKSE